MSPNDLKIILAQIVRPFVGHPESIIITDNIRPKQETGASVVELMIQGHPEDQGRLIGQEGRNASAFQTIMSAIGNRMRSKVFVQVLESRLSGVAKRVEFTKTNDPSRDDAIADLLLKLCGLCLEGPTLRKQISGEITELFITIKQPIAPELEAAIGRVFRGISKSAGRQVTIHIWPQEQSE